MTGERGAAGEELFLEGMEEARPVGPPSLTGEPEAPAGEGPWEGPGRPRSVVRETVIEALLDLVSEQGYAATSMDQVAERAGVAKSTIYRRWPSREALILEAHRSVVPESEEPDTGSLEGDLRAMVRQVSGALEDPRRGRLIQATLGEVVSNEALASVFREQLLQPRLATIQRAFERAAARGEIPAGLDFRAFSYMLLGGNLFRMSVMGEPADLRAMEQMASMLATILQLAKLLPQVRAAQERHERSML